MPDTRHLPGNYKTSRLPFHSIQHVSVTAVPICHVHSHAVWGREAELPYKNVRSVRPICTRRIAGFIVAASRLHPTVYGQPRWPRSAYGIDLTDLFWQGFRAHLFQFARLLKQIQVDGTHRCRSEPLSQGACCVSCRNNSYFSCDSEINCHHGLQNQPRCASIPRFPLRPLIHFEHGQRAEGMPSLGNVFISFCI